MFLESIRVHNQVIDVGGDTCGPPTVHDLHHPFYAHAQHSNIQETILAKGCLYFMLEEGRSVLRPHHAANKLIVTELGTKSCLFYAAISGVI